MKHKRLLKNLPWIMGAALVLLVAILVLAFQDLFEKPAQSKKQVQQVTVVQPPKLPPPPPPKPEIKPPEPKDEKLPEPEPEPEPETPEPEQPEEAPPGEQLGVDAEGGAGGDSFGLVGKKGGSGLIGGGGGNAIIWYGQHVQKELASELDKTLKDRARSNRYSAVLHVWINPNGDISRVELQNSSGTPEIDEALKQAISQIRGRFKPPPERMPQPLKIRVRS